MNSIAKAFPKHVPEKCVECRENIPPSDQLVPVMSFSLPQRFLHTGVFWILVFLAQCCNSTPIKNGTSNDEDITCRPLSAHAVPVQRQYCITAITRLMQEKPDNYYTMTHNAAEEDQPGMILCPYVKHVGNCAMVFDFIPTHTSLPSGISMTYLSTLASRLIDRCVGKAGVDGGLISFQGSHTYIYFRTWPPDQGNSGGVTLNSTFEVGTGPTPQNGASMGTNQQ